MDENNNKDRLMVYEIGYLLVPSIPEEQIEKEEETLKKIVTDNGAKIVAFDIPHREKLAYTMRKKTVSGSYEKFNQAYFGWIKFEVNSDKIEIIKKAFDKNVSVLRMLLITTVAENTYLGKRASEIAASFSAKIEAGDVKTEEILVQKENVGAPASIEEMDKSIDEMVKEAI